MVLDFQEGRGERVGSGLAIYIIHIMCGLRFSRMEGREGGKRVGYIHHTYNVWS